MRKVARPRKGRLRQREIESCHGLEQLVDRALLGRKVVVGKPDIVVRAPEVISRQQREQAWIFLSLVVDTAFARIAEASGIVAEITDDEIPGARGGVARPLRVERLISGAHDHEAALRLVHHKPSTVALGPGSALDQIASKRSTS